MLSVFSGCSFFVSSDYYDFADKVHFEGITISGDESNSEIAEIINKSHSTQLIIELNNPYVYSAKVGDSNELSDHEAQVLLMEQRKRVKEYYAKTNKAIFDTLHTELFDAEFRIDPYTPFIFGMFEHNISASDIENIYSLAQDEQISQIFVRSGVGCSPELDSAATAIGLDQIQNSFLLDGTGVIIGILDAEGVVDVENSIFSNAEIEVRDEWYYIETVSTHATQVAACALAVAPCAKILSVQQVGEISAEMEWMLDMGANVINMSFWYLGIGERAGTYTSMSAYCDYIVRDSWVTITCSAGNEGNGDKLVTPPNGYNTLTVGACNDSGIRSSFSSYEESFTINYPNFMAPGESIRIANYPENGGTSFSAPLTAGAVAILMDLRPALKLLPVHVMTILMATAYCDDIYYCSKGFNDEAGTGMLNLENALNSIDNRVVFVLSSDNVGDFVSTKQVYLKAGQIIKVVFASIVNNSNTQSTDLVTDYDLYLYDGNGKYLIPDVGLYNNAAICYEATTTGYYTIKIKQFSAKKTSLDDFCSYAYYIYNGDE